MKLANFCLNSRLNSEWMRVYRLFSFLHSYRSTLHYMQVICPFVSSPTQTNIRTYSLRYKHSFSVIISFSSQIFFHCVTHVSIDLSSQQRVFRFFRRMNIISGLQLSFVFIWWRGKKLLCKIFLHFESLLIHNNIF